MDGGYVGVLTEENGSDYDTPSAYRSAGSKRLCLAILGGAVLIAVGLAVGLGVGLRSGKDDGKEKDNDKQPETQTTDSSTQGDYGSLAAASDGALCSKHGSDMMVLKGGSVVDAAIATLLCNGLVCVQSMGIGGGFFMNIYNRTSRSAEILDARETAPAASTAEMYVNDTESSSTIGGKAVGIPGQIIGLWEAHQKYGKVPWKDLFTESIKLARTGIPISKHLANAISVYSERMDSGLFPALKSIFYDTTKSRYKTVEDTFTLPKLADTYATIADQGPSAFYNGSLTDNIVADIADEGGIITREDLVNYRTSWKEPLTVSIDSGYTLYSVPPPGSGAIIGFILSILDGYGFTSDDLSTNEKAILTYHRIVEAMKFAYAKRTNLGDADFVNVTDLINNLTSKAYGDAIQLKITDDKTHDTMYYEPTFYNEKDSGTSHNSFIDQDGNAVAVTSTINTYFGAKVIGSKTGIFFNNEMDDFGTPGLTNAYGLEPSPANFIEPGKRPLSSMSPTIMLDENGDVQLVVGASGGSKITTSTSLISMYTLWFGKDIGESIDQRRVHHQLLPTQLQIETGFPEEIIDGLRNKGHDIKMVSGGSVVQGILRKGDSIHAASDWRKGGAPYGY